MKNIDIWDLLENERKRDSVGLFGIPVKEDNIIQEAQQILGLAFTNSYIEFLKKFGGYMGDGHIVYGLIPLCEKGYLSETIIEKTNFFKEYQKWPNIESWYVISDDGSGNPIGIDPEGKVWLSDHDAGFEQIKLADSFEEFLYKLHTETLYE